jgi:hypothetical protein
MYVVPTPGFSIRDPDLQDLLPDEGREVPDSDYWHRRVRDNDVSLGTAPLAPFTVAKKADKGSKE